MKSKHFLLLVVCLILAGQFAFAAEKTIGETGNDTIDVTLFYGEECPHCHDAIAFLEELREENPVISIAKYEVWHSRENYELFKETVKKFGFDPGITGVPLIIIEGVVIEGFYPNKIRTAIESCVVNIEDTGACEKDDPTVLENTIFGKIDLKEMSLPMIALVLGVIDGINPCATWVLVFLIAVLLETKDKKKMWIIVGSFISASFIIYFFILNTWLVAHEFMQVLPSMTLIVGIVSIVIGAMHLKEYFSKKEAVCKVTNEGMRQKILNKLNGYIQKSITPATILGIFLIAFLVNMFEFVCSLGIPAIFTKILTLAELSFWEYQSYILLYDLAFMLDDIVLFGGAAITLQILDISKYEKIIGIFGGIVLVLLGIYLVVSTIIPGLM